LLVTKLLIIANNKSLNKVVYYKKDMAKYFVPKLLRHTLLLSTLTLQQFY